MRCFVIVSGLPGSGKTTVGRALAQALALEVLDKDDLKAVCLLLSAVARIRRLHHANAFARLQMQGREPLQ